MMPTIRSRLAALEAAQPGPPPLTEAERLTRCAAVIRGGCPRIASEGGAEVAARLSRIADLLDEAAAQGGSKAAQTVEDMRVVLGVLQDWAAGVPVAELKERLSQHEAEVSQGRI